MNTHRVCSWWEYDLNENYSETELTELISVLLNYVVWCLFSETKLWLRVRLKA